MHLQGFFLFCHPRQDVAIILLPRSSRIRICIFTTLMLTVAMMPTSALPPAVRGDRTSTNARTRRTLRTDRCYALTSTVL